MKKFAIPALMAVIIITILTAPALANATPATVAMPANTASPRDWDKYAPDGQLSPGKITADSAILIDAQSGKVLFEKDADKQRVPASITKIMTCLLALESGKSLSDFVTVGQLPQSDFVGASDIALKKGEMMTLETLLYGLMNQSGNDAADAIATYIAGDIPKFVDMMNAKAKELGMSGTHYANTNGLPIDDHYTTARDMATLTREAEKYPEFTKIVSTYKYTCPKTNMHNAERIWLNHDKLVNPSSSEIYSYKYATGVKTGFTDLAQHTLVSSAEKDGQKLIAIVLHDKINDKWTDSITMFEYGFHFYDTADVWQLLNKQSFSAEVKNAAGNDPGMGKLLLLLKPQSTKAFVTDSRDVIANIKNDPKSLIKSEVTYTKESAPIKRDEVVGTVTFSYNDAPILVCDLLASRDVEEMPTPAPSASAVTSGGASSGGTLAPGASPAATNPGTAKGGGSALLWLGIVALLLVLVLATIRFVNIRRRNSKYRQYNYRQGNGARLRR
jgi:serine-type D-Ala-D-Ala carboxypeptidase (penicillin-binding protein 5/6)